MTTVDDNESISSATGSHAGSVSPSECGPETASINSESDMQDILGKLDATTLDLGEREVDATTLIPDRDFSVTDTDSLQSGTSASMSYPDSDSIGATSNPESENTSLQADTDNDIEEHPSNGLKNNLDDVEEQTAVKTDTHLDENSTLKSDKGAKRKTSLKTGVKKQNPAIQLFKKLTKKKSKPKKEDIDLSTVTIDRLPQGFVARYLGKKPCKGLYGIKHTRKPVDDLIGEVTAKLDVVGKVELPLVYLIISLKGLDIREHKYNQVQPLVEESFPLEFISFGIQDIKYWRVFTFIVVRELSSRTKLTECYAYLCDTIVNARKMALSLGAAFRLNTKKLQEDGKPHKFQVDLTPPDEVAEDYAESKDASASSNTEECDA